MGIIKNIKHNVWPRQSNDLGKRIKVCFHYDSSHTITGVIVRDDIEDPYRMIIQLEDGKYVLSTECQWSFENEILEKKYS